MNTPHAYQRRTQPPSPQGDPTHAEPDRHEDPPALAVHGDPSQLYARGAPDQAHVQAPGHSMGPAAAGRQIAWVRPTELPTVVMTPVVGRGIDLHAELTRRARRSPITASRAGRRISRSAIARPEHATPTEGLQL